MPASQGAGPDSGPYRYLQSSALSALSRLQSGATRMPYPHPGLPERSPHTGQQEMTESALAQPFTVALVTVAKGWKQPWGPCSDEWTDSRMQAIRTMECH